jgi:putative mRNA 3-end processing factor
MTNPPADTPVDTPANSSEKPLLQLTEAGLYCALGDFYIDPWQPVTRAVITHAHADHARAGSRRYLTTAPGRELLRLRVQPEAHIQAQPYGVPLRLGEVTLSLHPAGHLLGSAQVRLEHKGEVWVVTGDYKTEMDRTCEAFELVPCHTLITESTFGLPIFHWRPQAEIFQEIDDWWAASQQAERTAILYGYALGKAQRLIAGLDPARGPILVHGAVYRMVEAYRRLGIALPPVIYADSAQARQHRGKALVVAPPSAAGVAGWLRKFGPISDGFASGWMQIRGNRRRQAFDRGFVLSDHADWEGLLSTIRATGATRIGVTHGYTRVLVRYLQERGWDAFAMPTRFEGEPVGEDPDQLELEQPDPDQTQPDQTQPDQTATAP